MSLLDVTGLGVRSGQGRELVSDVSFTLEAGARLGLIGESGSGKSLTALAIMGLLPTGMTASGSVVLDAPGLPRTQITGATERDLNGLRGRAVTVVFQEPLTALDPLMRVGRQLAEPLGRRHGLRGAALRRAVVAALEEVRLTEPDRIARAYPHEISGGQRQRVAIAMALACEPALLIADEPTTALDVTVQAEVLALLDGLVSARGMALLFISHDLAVISRITDHVLVLRDGRAVEAGAVRDIVNAPRHPYTRSLVDSARELDSPLDRITL
ncbi:ABC-type dipeptide/oligopeptide/nickel transport system, ATPase component [Streptosporangium subroseum]|uniref:ABC-type dipeptide/oligopeptide/nickel transport system, ATPase component n=1 Tax=Streptosporangium subroseum TaxID=106412 RepID=A0A239MLN0_9ACTN|nr:ABC transporter ATP-binding protein [Streptosporangium subroseum]SNT42719.1 ABC-type dipeptide/oligopeptide/nickel transport system, ATPase component [Streptosporangium subroseum]